MKPALKILNQLLKYKLTGKKIPIALNILTTNRCNFDCVYCYVDTKTRKMEDLPFEQMCKIIDDFYKIGTRYICVQGGEPLIREDIGKIVNYIKSKGMFCEVVTNGWFAEQKMDVLLKVDKVCFSIDGDEETHDKIRMKGSHQRIISALKKGKELGLNFRLHCVLNVYNMNKKNVDYLCNLAKGMNTLISFTYGIIPLQKQKEGRDKKELYFERKLLQDMLRYILECKRKGEPIHHSEKLLKRVIDWSLPYHEIGFKHNVPKNSPQCLYGRLFVFLDVDGILYPCSKYFETKERGASVIELGAKKAFEKVSNLDCVACGKLSELNTIFSINPVNLLKMSKSYI